MESSKHKVVIWVVGKKRDLTIIKERKMVNNNTKERTFGRIYEKERVIKYGLEIY